MLRITKSRSATAAKQYFRTELRATDYYLEGREVGANWCGLGAQRLGLPEVVTNHDFEQLLMNRTPEGQKLTPRDGKNRIPMFDLTFNAPKGVSMAGLMADPRLLEAHKRAVSEAMAEVEANLETRVRKGKAAQSNLTRNADGGLWAEFFHTTTRPIDGSPDPHAHSHCTLINAAYCPVEQRFKAIDVSGLYRDRGYFEACYHARLAKEVKHLGYRIERSGKWWDIAGIDKECTRKFSRRTQAIEAEAQSQGLVTARKKDALGKLTREQKGPEAAIGDLPAFWKSRMTTKERTLFEWVIKQAYQQKGRLPAQTTAQHAFRHGLDKAFERYSVAREKQVLEDALRFGFGDVTLERVKTASRATPLIRGKAGNASIISTQEMLKLEDEMVAAARKGRMTCRPYGHGNYTLPDWLTEDQRRAVRHIWNSKDRICCVEGDAGTGKTSGILAQSVAGLKAAGHRVITTAPTTAAVKELAREVEADAFTVSRLLGDISLHAKYRGSVVVVDEASMVGVRDLSTLFRLSEQQHFRLILVGDSKQHSSVSAGDALRVLQERAGLHTARVAEIVRQKGQYRDAVEAVSHGDIAKGWKGFERLGAVVEIEDRADRHAAIAKDYRDAIATGQSCLVVTATHREKNAIAEHIRDGLKRDGVISGHEHRVTRFRNTQWTQAERSDPALYEVGMTVSPMFGAKGLRCGERYEVIAKDDRGIPVIRDSTGSEKTLPLESAAQFKVYGRDNIELAKGDRIRITENSQTVRGTKVTNGAVFTVRGFDANGQLRIDGGRRLGRDFAHIDYAYCSTSPAAQGQTVDRVLTSLSSEHAHALSREAFYVNVSRGRFGVRLYVDDREAVQDAVTDSSARASALELADGQVDEKLRPTTRNRMQEHHLHQTQHCRYGAEHATGPRIDPGMAHSASQIPQLEPSHVQ